MEQDPLTRLERLRIHAHKWRVGRLFFDKRFFHYFWTGGVFTLLNIFLVWLFIDIFHIPTIIASSVVIGGLFIGRYAVYRWFDVM